MRSRRATILVALFVGALALRAQVTGVSPLFPLLHADLGVPHAVVGLLTTIPVLCMGLFAPFARDAGAWLGLRRAFAACLLLIAVGGVARAAVPGAVGVILLTIPVGIGMGVAGPLLPMLVKEHFAERPAFATGVYATGLQISAAIAAGVASPVASAWGGWRAPLGLFSAATFALFVAWIVLMRGVADRTAIRPERLRLPVRSGIVWLLVGIFGLQSLVYYGLTAWLPDLYVERGWSEHRAGLLLSLVNLVGIPTGIVVPWFADRVGSRRAYIGAAAALTAVALLGIQFAPAGAWVWVVLAGAAGGVLFAVTLTLPLDVAERHELGSVAGLMLLGGYMISGLGPVVLGAVRDLTGGFAVGLTLLVVASCGILVGGLALTPARLGRGLSRA